MIDSSPRAFPAFRQLFRDDFPPLLRSLDPFLRSLNPMLQAIGSYKHELSALVANAAATTNGVSLVKRDRVHYLRTLSLLSPESVATYPGRLRINRNNAYSKPGIYSKLAAGLPNFDTSQCAAASPPSSTRRRRPIRRSRLARTAMPPTRRTSLTGCSSSRSTANSPPTTCRHPRAASSSSPSTPFGAQGAKTAYPHVVQQAK